MPLIVVHHHVHHHHGDETLTRALVQLVAAQMELLTAMSHTLEETLDLVKRNLDRSGSVVALLEGLKAQLKEATAQVRSQSDLSAKIDQIFDAATAESGRIDTALNTGVPASDAATPAPTPVVDQTISSPAAPQAASTQPVDPTGTSRSTDPADQTGALR